MRLTAAVTGASGYLGSHLADFLEQGGWDVRRMSRSGAHAWTLGGEADLSGTSALIHCAHDFRDPKANVEGAARLLDEARRAAVTSVIFVSSLAAFEGCKSIYGQTKLEIEHMVVKEGGIVARPGTIFGGKAGGIMGTMQRVVSRLPIVPMIGMGSTRLYMVHVTDLSRCLERLARTPDEFRGSVVSIAALKPITFRALLAAMAAAEHRRRIFVPIPGALIRAGLVIAETLGLRLPLRSDSVVSLLAGNPRVELDGRFENLEPFSVRLS